MAVPDNQRDLLEFVDSVSSGVRQTDPASLRSLLQTCSPRFLNILKYNVCSRPITSASQRLVLMICTYSCNLQSAA